MNRNGSLEASFYIRIKSNPITVQNSIFGFSNEKEFHPISRIKNLDGVSGLVICGCHHQNSSCFWGHATLCFCRTNVHERVSLSGTSRSESYCLYCFQGVWR